MNRSSLQRFGLVAASLALFWIWGAAAFLKALDPPGFAQQITMHGVSPAAWSPVLAYFFITVEAVLAIALITFFRPRLTFLGSIFLLVLFIIVSGIAWATGHTEGCGCFGRLAGRQPWQVILEDSGFLAIAAVGFVLAKGLKPPWFSKVMFPTLLPLAIALPFVGPSIPADSLVTTLNPGADVSNMAASNLRVHLDRGQVLLVLIGDSCKACDDGLPNLEAIAAADSAGAPPIAAIFAGTRAEAQAWTLNHVPPFGVGDNPVKVLRQYYRKLPQAALLDSGKVVTVWRNRIPTWDELRNSMKARGLLTSVETRAEGTDFESLPDSLKDKLRSGGGPW